MSYLERNLKQDLVYWAPGTPDGFGGKTFITPVAILGRWEDRTNLFIDSNGNESRSSSRVYLKQDVVLEGYLFLGTSTASDPLTVAGAKEIRDFRKIPDLAATSFERRVLL
jgi:hypothetical protein